MKRQLYPISKKEFEIDTSIINISEMIEDYVRQITTQIDNLVIENLPDEVLKKLKNKIDKEYKKRCKNDKRKTFRAEFRLIFERRKY